MEGPGDIRVPRSRGCEKHEEFGDKRILLGGDRKQRRLLASLSTDNRTRKAKARIPLESLVVDRNVLVAGSGRSGSAIFCAVPAWPVRSTKKDRTSTI